MFPQSVLTVYDTAYSPQALLLGRRTRTGGIQVRPRPATLSGGHNIYMVFEDDLVRARSNSSWSTSKNPSLPLKGIGLS